MRLDEPMEGAGIAGAGLGDPVGPHRRCVSVPVHDGRSHHHTDTGRGTNWAVGERPGSPPRGVHLRRTGNQRGRETEWERSSSAPTPRSTGWSKTPTAPRAPPPEAGSHPSGGKDREAWAEVETAEAIGTDALLLGRRSYEWLATRWASRSGVWADRLNGLPKYVVSSTLPDEAATWGPTTVLRGDPTEQRRPAEVGATRRDRRLRQLPAGARVAGARSRRRVAARRLASGGRCRQPPVRRGQREEAPAPRRCDHHR